MSSDVIGTIATTSPFRCTVPGRKKSAVLSLLAFAMAAAFLFVPAPVGWLLFLVCIPFGVLFLLAAAVPAKFLEGVALVDDGFEFRAPLRSPKFIPFGSIRRIEALARGDGDRGDAVHFLIYSTTGKAPIREDVLFGSGLFKVLESRLLFDHVVYHEAIQHKPRGMELLFGKRFTVYENKHA